MKCKKTDRVIFFSALLSLLMMTGFSLLRFYAEKGKLPLGYHYRVHGNGRILQRKIRTIDPKAIAALLEAVPGSRRIIFSADVFQPKSGRIFLHTDRPEEIEVYMNGRVVQTGETKYFNPMDINKGFNRFVIRFAPKTNPEKGLKVALTEGLVLSPFPFYYTVLPGDSFGKGLFSAIRFIDRFKSYGFFLAILLLLIRFFPLWKERIDFIRPKETSLWFLVFQYSLLFLSLQILTAFLLDIADLRASFPALWAIPAVMTTGYAWMWGKNRLIPKRIDFRKTAMAVASLLLVSGFVFVQSGRAFPAENIGYGDLNNHLAMMKSIEYTGEFYNEDHKQTYPQAPHAVIVAWAKLLGWESEEILTPWIMIILACLIFILFLIGNSILPGIPLVFWLFAMALARWPYLFQNVFISYSFPAVLAVMLFLVSLYFKFKGEEIPSVILITASLAVYPYFAIPFALTYATLSMRGKFPPEFQKLKKTAFELLPAFLVLLSFFFRFFRYSLPDRDKGFFASFLWNPFEALHFWNTFLILAGILVILAFYKRDFFPSLYLGITLGFLANYMVYAVFQGSSTYYVMKNVLYLIPLGVIPAAAAISTALKKPLRSSAFRIVLYLLLPLFFAAFFLEAVHKLPSPSARGVTEANRWLISHTKPDETVIVAADDSNLTSLFSLTLGNRRPLRAVSPSDLSPTHGEQWMILDTRISPSPPAADSWKKRFHSGDFNIYEKKDH